MRPPPRAWLLAASLAALAVVLALSPGVRQAVAEAVTWAGGAGAAGVAVFAAVYVVCTLVALPASILCVAAGWAWGLGWGTLLVQGVSLVADWLPFVLARRWGRGRTLELPALRGLEAALRERGLLVVFLLRLSPLAPYNAMNYLFGLTPVSTTSYLVGSILGSTPSCLFYVGLGTLVPRPGEVSLLDHPVALALSLAAALLALLAVGMLARRALRRQSG